MTDTSRAISRVSGRQWWQALALLAVAAVGAWGARAALWPCGALDRSSGCIASVTLDVGGLGLPPGETSVDFRGMDLGPEASMALVALKAQTDAGRKVLLALFDARTGQPIRALAEASGADLKLGFGEIALSSDGTLAAAVVPSPGEAGLKTALNVYRVADGGLVRTLWEVPADEKAGCVSALDFSPDGRKLQCGTSAYDLETGVPESLIDATGNFRYPVFAAFSALGADAPDGTTVSPSDLNAALDLFDSTQSAFFAADSRGLLSLRTAHYQNRGQRLYTPPVFRRMAAVTLWDGKTLKIQREFHANRRYDWAAWSQDATMFGLLTEDLRLDVFSR
ncbi:MAG: hypothetical protein ACK4GM_13925 [Tabrizicola sp.]